MLRNAETKLLQPYLERHCLKNQIHYSYYKSFNISDKISKAICRLKKNAPNGYNATRLITSTLLSFHNP